MVSENNDLGQFDQQIDQANEVLEKKGKVACADSGYASTRELEKIAEQGIKVIVPSQRQASRRKPTLFAKEHFSYDRVNNGYILSRQKGINGLNCN